jgi:PAS domain S-box-containing protein
MSPTIFALFYPTVMVSTLEGGLGPGLLSLVLATVITKYLFLPPVHSLAFAEGNTFFRLSVLVLVALMICMLSTSLRRAKRQTEVSLLKLQSSEEKYRRIVETANEGIWLSDAESRTTYVNSRMAQMLGYSPHEMLGRSCFDFMDDANQAESQRRFKQHQQGIGEQTEFCFRCKDGSPLWVQSNTNPIVNDSGECIGVLGMITDITERKRAEQHVAVQYAVSRVLAEATTLSDAVPTILQSLCQSLGWQVGMIWRLDRQANVLRYVESWHTPTVNMDEFEAANQHTTFSLGSGLPGRIWASGQPTWISNLIEEGNFPRAVLADQAGLHAVFGFPIRLGNDVLGVIECFSDKIQEPDEDLLRMMAIIGSQIGQFMERRRVEEELAESQKLFLSFMNNIPGTAFIKDEQGRYLFTNPVGERLVNRKLADIVGKTDFDLMPAQVAQSIRDNDIAIFTTGQPIEELETLPQGDGSHYWMSFKFPVQDASGKQMLAGMSFDITERKRLEEALRESEQRYRLLAESLPQLVWTGQPDGQTDYCNQHWYNYTGLTQEQTLGDGWTCALHPDDREQTKARWQKAVETGESYQIEYRLKRAVDGQYRWHLASIGPVYNSSGQLIKWVGTAIDITERKRAEEALRASENLYRTLSEAVPNFIWSCDNEGKVDFVNLRWLEYTGMKLEELNAGGLEQVSHPDDLPQVMQQWERAKQKGEPLEVECRYRRKDGLYRWFMVRAVSLQDGVGNSVKWIGTTTDIHERKQAEMALQKSETLLNALLASSPIGFAFLDNDLRYIQANEALAAINGLPLTEHLGHTVWEVLSEQAPQIATIAQQVMQTQEPLLNWEVSGATNPAGVHRHCLVSYYPVCLPEGQVLGVGVTSMDITDRKRTEQAQQFLAEASQVLSSSLDYQTTLTSIAQLIVPQVADWCTVHLVEEDGSVQSLATTHANPAKIAWAQEINQKYPFDPNAPRGLAQVLRTGQSELYSDIPDYLLVEAARDAEHLQLLREVGFTSVMMVPLVVRGRTLGAISFIAAESGRRYALADLVLAEELAHRAALAVENARLYRQAQQARQTAEVAAARTLRLQSVTAAFSEALTSTQVAEVAVKQGIAALGVEAGFVALLTDNGTTLEIAESVGLPPTVLEAWRHFPITASVPIAETVRTGEPIFLESVEAFATRYAILAHVPTMTGNQTFACIPLTVEGRTLGGLSFSFPEAIPFSEEDRAFMITLGHLCGQAITRARLYEAEQQARAVSEAARAEAEAANRIKDEFLAVLSHELRSPLNPILGWTKLLRSRQFDPKATDRALETIERNAKLQTQLIEDLLDVSRILRGKMVLHVAPVNLVTTIEAALETVHLAAQAKDIQIQTVLDSKVGQVSGDANRLQQVVWNLVSNAVKFTPRGGWVEVRLEAVEDRLQVESSNQPSNIQPFNLQPSTHYAQIQVKDNGKGISPEFLPHVFEYFRQESSTTTRKFGGLGLGLAIVRHLVELHGGTVFAESPGEGLGATFTLRLPVMVTQPKPPQEQVRFEDSADLCGLRILVVDDEADIRELVSFILEQSGAEVIIAASAQEALAALNQSLPDVLVSDIGMPDVDGYMLMRQIRDGLAKQNGQLLELNQTIPKAIALTAYAGEYDQKQALQAGFQLHISKPVEPEDLIKAIARLVGRS